MKDFKIISIDLDGTLLNENARVSPENIAAAEELVRRGVQIVPNTGRAYNEMPVFVKELPFVRYIIFSDGGVIYDKKTGEKLLSCMSAETGRMIIDILHSYRTSLIVHHDCTTYVNADENDDESYDAYRVPDGFRRIIHESAILKKDYWSFCRGLDGIEMICAFFASDEEKEECRKRIEATGRFHIASSHPYNIEFFAIEAGKGNSLLKLARSLNVPVEATVAIGDSTNDSDMIKKAGLGIAMENACDELKEIAGAVACRNTEHILKYMLERYYR